LNVTGGLPPYQYQWSNSSTGTQLTSLPAGKYSVTVTDANHCPGTLTINLPDSTEHIVLNVIVNPEDGCEPLTVKIDNNTQQPGNYLWSFGDGTTVSSPDPTHVYSLPGNYSLDVIFTSAEGCIDTFSGVSIIHVYDLPVAEFSETPSLADTFSVNSATFYFTNQSTGMVSCTWNFGDSTTSNYINPVHTYKQPGSFMVTLIAENSDGCTDTIRSREIEIVPEGNYFIPNTFTPNGDGVNDYFKVYGYSVRKYTLSVYSRWGERVYESDGTDKGWDGTFHGMPMNADVFVYYAEIQYLDGRHLYVKGDVTLLR
jgi:gliding motility-associated-like protein